MPATFPPTSPPTTGSTPLYRQGATGAGQTVAIVTLAALDPGRSAVLLDRTCSGLPASSRTVTVVNVDGGPGAPSDASGTGETDLDVEQSGGLAPDANVIVYQAPNTDVGFADAFFKAASQNSASSCLIELGRVGDVPRKQSSPAGEETPAYEAAFDEAFLEMAAQGQSGFIASGDAGAYDGKLPTCGPRTCPSTPSADSPFITAAGGTTLPWTRHAAPGRTAPQRPSLCLRSGPGAGTTYGQPVASINGIAAGQRRPSSVVVGSGGGFSTIEPTPSYQQGVPGTSRFSAVQYLTPTDLPKSSTGSSEPTAWNFNPTPSVTTRLRSRPGCPRRLRRRRSRNRLPPVRTLATRMATRQPLQGGWGGTSFVAPQLNGSTAVIDSFLGHRVGFWNPVMYSVATGARTRRSLPLDSMRHRAATTSTTRGHQACPSTKGAGLGYPDLSRLAFDFREDAAPSPGMRAGGRSAFGPRPRPSRSRAAQ